MGDRERIIRHWRKVKNDSAEIGGCLTSLSPLEVRRGTPSYLENRIVHSGRFSDSWRAEARTTNQGVSFVYYYCNEPASAGFLISMNSFLNSNDARRETILTEVRNIE